MQLETHYEQLQFSSICEGGERIRGFRTSKSRKGEFRENDSRDWRFATKTEMWKTLEMGIYELRNKLANQSQNLIKKSSKLGFHKIY